VVDLKKDAEIARNFELSRLTVKPNQWPELKVNVQSTHFCTGLAERDSPTLVENESVRSLTRS
jgi:hypothetical protein